MLDKEGKPRGAHPDDAPALSKARMLYGEIRTGDTLYCDAFHPENIVAFFQKRARVEDPQEIVTDRGQVSYVTKPTRPPTFEGYAAHINVASSTLREWKKAHHGFEQAVTLCADIQYNMIVQESALGNYNAGFTGLLMKNIHSWADKVETEIDSTVTLKIDPQDQEA